LEHLLLARGGTAYLQIHGTAVGLQDPVFSATLAEVAPPTTAHFTASLSGANEVPPNTSPYHIDALFGLSGNCLHFTLAADAGFAWGAAGILGPANRHSNSTNIASFPMLIGVSLPGQPQVIYNGDIPLSDEAVELLYRGELYVSFASAQYPAGELRGQIVPMRAGERRTLSPRETAGVLKPHLAE